MADIAKPSSSSSSSAIATTNQQQNEPAMKGWLFKWTNYLKGYQRRWFVLQNGHLSYYRNQAEMAHTCRGSISLHGALIYTVDACTFVISNGGTQTFHIRAASEVERQSWVTALELAKAKAIRSMESEEDEEDDAEEGGGSAGGSQEEWALVVKKLEAQLNDIQTCSDLIQKHWKSLVKSLSEIETNLDVVGGDACVANVQTKSKEVSERATLFRISTNAMINSCAEYLKTAQTHGHKWIRLLQHEREQRQRLQEMVETLAQQHSKLEQAAEANAQHQKHRPSNAGGGVPSTTTTSATSEAEEDEDNEFYDAVAESSGQSGGAQANDEQFTLNIPTHRRNNSSDSTCSEAETETETKQVVVVTSQANKFKSNQQQQEMLPNSSSNNDGTLSSSKRPRRTRVPDKPNYPLNLWNIMKNCIGKDLSKIPMPVNFSEPLSMLQRLTEDYEYADILDKAAKCQDVCQQLAYVAAFTISAYSTTSSRTGKPFNPLLGETYECDRLDDLGWRAISEQVSHHPPMVAQYCEGRNGWKCWQEFTMTSKFRGKYLQVIPLGIAHVEFANGNKFSWRKVTTTIHNIIVGKLWVDQHGDMEIIGKNNSQDIKCHLKYIPYSYFTRDSQRRVKGVVMDQMDSVKWIINGTWDDQVEIAPVIGNKGSQTNPVYQTGTSIVAWKRRMPAPDAEKYYGFTVLASQLNEMEEGVAPTDSRLRPDQRLMEEGRWDEANAEKLRLEEKQRAARRLREAANEQAANEGKPSTQYQPIWFDQISDESNDNVLVHVYKGNYWQCKEKQMWDVCPDIF